MLPWQEKRQDLVVLPDRVLNVFPCCNTCVLVNVTEHAEHIFYAYQAFVQQTVPAKQALLGWMLLCWTRALMLYVCPFRVRADARFLNDFLLRFVLGDIPPFENDLFFSGHVSGSVMMGLTSTVNRTYYFWSALAIAVCMLFSKVHYTVDLLVAPYVAFGSYHLAGYLLNTLLNS
jgi:hypothetical protein